MRRGLAFVALALLLVSPMSVQAQEATVVASPTAERCDLSPYIRELMDLQSDAVGAFAAIVDHRFGSLSSHPDGWLAELLATHALTMLPAERLAVAGVYEEWADALERTEPPFVAASWHADYLRGVRLWANLWRDAATLGFTTAWFVYAEDIEALRDQRIALINEAKPRCPALWSLALWFDHATREDQEG